MKFKESIKIQLKNWRWWAALLPWCIFVLASIPLIIGGVLSYIAVFIFEISAVALVKAWLPIANWRNKPLGWPVKKHHGFNGLFIKV